MWKNLTYLVLASALLANTVTDSLAQEADLLAVLRSQATLEEKSAACRQLTRIGTKEAVPTLAALLGDEKLSHMARYALEAIPDPSVDDALREALDKVQGRQRLGVIGSLGARRDSKAVGPLASLLGNADTLEKLLGNLHSPILRPAAHPDRSQGHIVDDFEVGKEVELLKYHADLPLHRMDVAQIVGQLDPVHDNRPLLMFLQTIDAADKGGFSTARGSAYHDHFAFTYGQIHAP